MAYPYDMTATSIDHIAPQLFAEVDRAARGLVGRREVSQEVHDLIDRIADQFAGHPETQLAGVDPYLGQAFLSALLACEKGVRAAHEDERRRRVRIGFERVRQALRDIADEAPSAEARTTKEVVRWLEDTVNVPQAELAGLHGVSSRTWQRWTSPTSPTEPEGDDEARVRAVARVVAHLRHVFTAPGVIRWFERPHPELGGRRPADLLADPLEIPRLTRLAAGVRSTVAS